MDGDTNGFGRYTQSSTAVDLGARRFERATAIGLERNVAELDALGADLPYDFRGDTPDVAKLLALAVTTQSQH